MIGDKYRVKANCSNGIHNLRIGELIEICQIL